MIKISYFHKIEITFKYPSGYRVYVFLILIVDNQISPSIYFVNWIVIINYIDNIIEYQP